jgi:hypothetical protein
MLIAAGFMPASKYLQKKSLIVLELNAGIKPAVTRLIYMPR